MRRGILWMLPVAAAGAVVFTTIGGAPGDLHNGKLQVLPVLNAAHQPITFTSESTFPSADQTALHTYGNLFDTQWVTIHDTAVDGTLRSS